MCPFPCASYEVNQALLEVVVWLAPQSINHVCWLDSAAPLAKKLLPATSLAASSVAFVLLGGFDLEVVFELLLVLVLVLRHLPK